MGIDLELPSYEQDNLLGGSIANIDIMDSADVENEDTGGTIENGGNVAGDDIIDGGAICEPRNGLQFETKEAAYSFYREYARSIGFGITIKASRRSKKSGKFIDVKIACSRFGCKRDSSTGANPRSCMKTDCKAGMHMKRTQNDKWIIYNFTKEHNHQICPADFHKSIQGRNKQSGVVSSQKKWLQLALDHNDIQDMLEHFMCMQAENSGFFYSLDLDHEKRLRNVFWVDAKARHDYSFFSDVVFFDTFYVTNNYTVPYTSIIGVNHHSQFMLLGCALIGQHTASTFVWLMKTWCKAVGGQAPKVILTEQEKCLNEAVANVFPSAHHCFCLWHVLDKMPENLSHLTTQDKTFMQNFNKCIHRSWTDEQFEKRWWKMVDKFHLREDKWVLTLYKDRKKWVPIYMQDTFLGGMSTTERYGSIASFFDKYICREATFKEFMVQYKLFLQDRLSIEAKADFETQNRQLALRSHSAFEQQMSRVYTNAMFKKFQVEVLGVVSCKLQRESEDGTTLNFWVEEFEEGQNFLVAWDKTRSHIHCLCRSFEYRGFLCKHAILVLQMSGVSNIPSHYILKRWTKDAKTTQIVTEVSNSLPYRVQRFNDLCKRSIRLGESGSLCQEAYHIASQALEEILQSCVAVNNSVRSVLEPSLLAVHGVLETEVENFGKSMGKLSKKKKTNKRKKVLPQPEGMTMSSPDSYQQLEPINARGHATDNCFVPQPDTQDMELGSRPPAIDGFFGTQHNMQGVGISPFRDGYYSNQQSMPSLGHLHSIPICVSSYSGQQSLQGQLGFRTASVQSCFDIHGDMQDTEQPVGSTRCSGIAPKHLHEKRLSH